MVRRLTAIAILLLATVSPIAAQAGGVPENVISIQPLSAILKFYAGEFERATGKAVTLGAGATHWSIGDSGDDLRYTSWDFKLRYYPAGTALQGFSFGGSVGYANVRGNSSSGPGETVGGPSIGVLLEYQWLLGERKNFAFTLGAGAKALNINEADVNDNDFVARYPTVRISVGWAF